MEKIISWDEFGEQFKPTKNVITERDEFNGWLYETYGEDEAYIRRIAEQSPDHVWTIVDVGYLCIVSGWHFVNRFGYIITELPCPNGVFITVEDDDDKEDGDGE